MNVELHYHPPGTACEPGCPEYQRVVKAKAAATLDAMEQALQAQRVFLTGGVVRSGDHRPVGATFTTNSRDEWVPAIPEPLFLAFGRCRCHCGVTRWGRVSYREHYALVHIVGLAG